MPSKESHVAAAVENQKVIDYLCERIEDYPGWVAVVAFYKALHVVEATFASNSIHMDNHRDRNRLLKSDPRYSHIWKNYRPLWDASLIARYLREDEKHPTHDVFATYMPPEVVKAMILGHYLRQVEKSSGAMLGDSEFWNKRSS
jgi:hypothetical protein